MKGTDGNEMAFFEPIGAGSVLSQCDNHATLNGTKNASNPHPAGNGGSHWAGAQRPKARTATAAPPEDITHQSQAGNCINTNQGVKALNLKLRNQAKELGMIPGSPRWRAYVLGTVSASAKRKRKKDKAKC